MKSVLASYTLSLAVFIPISGWVANRFGTRRVFASAIGLFTLGSLLCGLSSNIHLLVACRILQGCGGAMMVPVGRLTLVRTFAKSELIRAMSFVAIPGLIGPMLGPLAGGLIVGYFHWQRDLLRQHPHRPRRPVPGLPAPAGLSRGEASCRSTSSGLILFGSGIALLSYVLEVFGEHTLERRRRSPACWPFRPRCWPATACMRVRTAHPLLQLGLFRIRTFRAAVSGSFFTRLGIGGMPVPAAAALPGRPRLSRRPIRPADHAAGIGRHQHQVHAGHSESSVTAAF